MQVFFVPRPADGNAAVCTNGMTISKVNIPAHQLVTVFRSNVRVATRLQLTQVQILNLTQS